MTAVAEFGKIAAARDADMLIREQGQRIKDLERERDAVIDDAAAEGFRANAERDTLLQRIEHLEAREQSAVARFAELTRSEEGLWRRVHDLEAAAGAEEEGLRARICRAMDTSLADAKAEGRLEGLMQPAHESVLRAARDAGAREALTELADLLERTNKRRGRAKLLVENLVELIRRRARGDK